MINNHSCVPIVYGRATEAEAHARPTTDLLKTFRGPFKDIMQSKAMRWISQEDLDKHNYKAKQLAIEYLSHSKLKNPYLLDVRGAPASWSTPHLQESSVTHIVPTLL